MGAEHRHPNQRTIASLPRELRRTPVPPQVQEWVTAVAGSTIARSRRLPGASSTAVHGLVLTGGARLVLRRYAWPAFLVNEPDAPQREVDALAFALAHGLAVPEVVAADVTGRAIGDGIPALLMTWLAGQAVGAPDLTQLADVAASIHAVNAEGFGHRYFAWYEGSTTAPPPPSQRPALWERALELWATAMPPWDPVLIHRDFHPGNVLWSRGRLSGIVDWANACAGPTGCDVAHCRTNLLRLGGPEAADRFAAAYASRTGRVFHPYWEMAAILENGPSHWTSEEVAFSEPRLERAVRSLDP